MTSEQVPDPPLPPPEHVPEPPSPAGGQDAEVVSSLRRLVSTAVVFNAETTARRAEADRFNEPGYCLQWSREQAGIGPLYPSATVAWHNATDRQTDRRPPRGAFVFWVGGSEGHGHIAISLGKRQIRTSDGGGAGIVATRSLGWFDTHWTSLRYVGWADNVNGVTVPGVRGDWFDMADENDLRRIVREEINEPAFIAKVAEAVWDETLVVTDQATGQDVKQEARRVLRQVWQKVDRHI